MTKQFEELRQAYKELLSDNQQLTADNRKLRKEVTELKQLNDGYVKIIAKNQETNNKLMASVQKQTCGDLISRADAIEAVCDGCVWYKTASCEEGKEEWECSEVNKIRHLPSADAVSREEYEEVKEEYINTVGAILAVISAPSCLKEVNDLIEPLKAVRCKDCRWFKQDSSPVGYGYCDGRMVGREVDYNDYCSHGKRREK